jgi:hypothetical protein
MIALASGAVGAFEAVSGIEFELRIAPATPTVQYVGATSQGPTAARRLP